MKNVIAAIAACIALVLPYHALAVENDFKATTDKALAAGDAAAVVKALDKEIYRGNLLAAHTLGLMYRDGKLVAQDYAQARKWLKISAKEDLTRIWFRRGMSDSQYALGLLLRDGRGGKPDAEAAASWFEQAAEQGDAQAALALAQLRMGTNGVKRNAERAFFWSSVAARNLTEAAQKDAEQLRDQARAQLAPEQLKKAEDLANNWTPKRS